MDQDLIIIGKTFNTHGLKGALKVFPLTDDPSRFTKLKRVILVTEEGTEKTCTLSSVRVEKRQAILTFEEITTVEEAQNYTHAWVKIPVSETLPLAENQFYHFELIGLSVYLDNGAYLGRLEEILETGSNDVFIVRRDHREHLIPALRDVIKEVDIKEKRMTVHHLEGLIEYHAV